MKARTLFVLLFAFSAGCGAFRGGTGDTCGEAGDCVSALCLVACSDPCRAEGKDPSTACGPRYCADPAAPDAAPVNQSPCHAK